VVTGILGIVPARSGSIRVLNKNIRLFGGRPLLEWTVRAAREAGCLSRIIVSTDCEDIAEIARKSGAEAPWLRSPALASATADVVDAVLEVLDRVDAAGESRPEGVMLLQPTSPFRTSESIRVACALFASGQGKSVVSVRPARDHPAWCMRLDERGCLQPLTREHAPRTRSQDLPAVFSLNGAIYVATPENISSRRSFHSPETIGFIMRSQIEGLDIDTPEDWDIAEAYAITRRWCPTGSRP